MLCVLCFLIVVLAVLCCAELCCVIVVLYCAVLCDCCAVLCCVVLYCTVSVLCCVIVVNLSTHAERRTDGRADEWTDPQADRHTDRPLTNKTAGQRTELCTKHAFGKLLLKLSSYRTSVRDRLSMNEILDVASELSDELGKCRVKQEVVVPVLESVVVDDLFYTQRSIKPFFGDGTPLADLVSWLDAVAQCTKDRHTDGQRTDGRTSVEIDK